MNMQRTRRIVTSEKIVDDLLKKIESLKYMPGELISEGDLCAAYDTTRHTVRGALAVLKERGFVDVFPQRGTFVSLIDLDFINDVLYLREAIEQETVRRIIEKGNNEKLIKDLRACLAKQKAIKDYKADPNAFYKLDDEFHNLLLAAVGRPHLPNLYEDAFMHVRRWRNMEVGTLERIGDLPKEHEMIIEAIEKEDVVTARDVINHHIDSVARYGNEMKKKYPEYFI